MGVAKGHITDAKDVRGADQSCLPQTLRADRKGANCFYRIDSELGSIGFKADLCPSSP